MSSIALKKPPVIESWIECRFNFGSDREPFDEKNTNEFLALHKGFKFQDCLTNEEVHIQWPSSENRQLKASRKVGVARVRACDEKQEHWLQLLNDGFIYNALRNGEAQYVGYDRLLAATMTTYQKYVNLFGPTSVANVALCYVDMVEVPMQPGGGQLRLEDVFCVYPKFPDAFGAVNGLSLSLSFPSTEKAGRLTLKLVSAEHDLEKLLYRF
jgi:uncharacterized protein (TIGR04255 family)